MRKKREKKKEKKKKSFLTIFFVNRFLTLHIQSFIQASVIHY